MRAGAGQGLLRPTGVLLCTNEFSGYFLPLYLDFGVLALGQCITQKVDPAPEASYMEGPSVAGPFQT